MYFLNQLLNGLQIGSIYALIALGYTMVYGIIKLINFAHGDIMMVGAYIALILVEKGLPFYWVVPLTMLLAALLGMLIDQIAYKPLRNSSRLSALITAIGVSLFLQNGMMILFTSSARSFPDLTSQLPSLKIGETSLNLLAFISFGSAILLMVILQLFITKSKAGIAMRAVAQDRDAAELMGVDCNQTIRLTFAIGSALAAFAAILYVLEYKQVNPYIGAMPGIKAFVAAVLGGIGLIPGAMLGGFILGIVEALTKAYIPSQYSPLADAVVFAILIFVLLIKPTGLLGKSCKEKV